MKYRVENKLDLFEFHDAEFSFVRFDKNELVLSAKHLNIHKNATQNPNDCDMEIDFAEFVFIGFDVFPLSQCEHIRWMMTEIGTRTSHK